MRVFSIFTLLLVGAACTTIRPGEVAVRQSFGHLAEEHRDPGFVLHSPVGVRFVKVPVRTQNLEIDLELPASEGLNVRSTVSILYRAKPAFAPKLIQEVGTQFERDLVLPVFRSKAADVSARFAAKDMHSGARSDIETAIASEMNGVLDERGIVVESVLLKSIQLPTGLYAAVEEKLEAEQAAQRMGFVLLQEEREAERRRIEAQGIRDAQRILEEGLSPQILAWRSIEAFTELANSPNTKVIVTDGDLPFLIDAPEATPAVD